MGVARLLGGHGWLPAWWAWLDQLVGVVFLLGGHGLLAWYTVYTYTYAHGRSGLLLNL